MRILITGSREWTNSMSLTVAIYDARQKALLHPHEVTIVSGNASRGADRIAETYARNNGYVLELHPAQWRPFGIYNPQAGKLRNSEMVALGADICLAFIKDGSPGATDCADKAEAAGIPTKRYLA